MDQQKIIDEIEYYKAQTITELLYTSGKVWKRKRHIMKRGSGCIPTKSTLAYFMISASLAQKQMSVTACRHCYTNAASVASTMY